LIEKGKDLQREEKKKYKDEESVERVKSVVDGVVGL